ncbi:endonuclease/exonuclease/phosphatase family protein [Zhouia sp. PK063]|uniref:endonuclease/exonuclease/phosphatase family protein n=1 Tax=Zhouia sp. PK063 TaxID=3373602 RepID=UPI0037968061
MKIRLLFISIFWLIGSTLYAQLKVASWNIQNLGQSKSATALQFITQQLKDFDVVAIQEVVAGPGGAQAVAKIADLLNRTGSKWDYRISDPTQSNAYSRERYAFLWKTSKIQLEGKAWLDSIYTKEIDREPYMARFCYNNKEITLVNMHAIPKTKKPETEIKYLKFYPQKYPGLSLVFLGDFNCPATHTVFTPLNKLGFQTALIQQKTSLKRNCVNGCLASAYDNFYVAPNIHIVNKGIIKFYEAFTNFEQAHQISDHIPIWVQLTIN